MNTQPKTKTTILKLHRATPEARKVSVEDGYTSIPNQLLDAILEFDFSNAQRKVVLAVLRKTLSWRKEVDWICNEQLAELANLPDISKASRTKNELLRMNVLVQDGKKIGVNLIISEWKNAVVQNDKFAQNNNQSCTKQQKLLYKTTTTKETIQNINKNTPLPPTGESACADSEVSIEGLENQSKPAACKKTKKPAIDYQAVAELYNQANEDTGSRLPTVLTVNDERKRAIKKFLGSLKEPTLSCAEKYFAVFFEDLKPHHLGQNDRGWRANFDFAIRPNVVLRVREDAL